MEVVRVIRVQGKWRGLGEIDYCELPFVHKHMAKLVFGAPNVEVHSRANRSKRVAKFHKEVQKMEGPYYS